MPATIIPRFRSMPSRRLSIHRKYSNIRLVGSSAMLASIHPRLRLDIADLVGQRVGVHRPVVDGDVTLLVEPGERMLHPALVVAFGEILTRVSAAAFRAIACRIHGHDRLRDEIV